MDSWLIHVMTSQPSISALRVTFMQDGPSGHKLPFVEIRLKVAS